MLALGPNSSVIKGFLDAGLIPSSFMDMWFGSRSETRPSTGELTLRGIDHARHVGGFTKLSIGAPPMKIPCPLSVKVRSMNINNDQGSFPLIEGAPVPACIDPLQNSISASKDIMKKIYQMAGLPIHEAGAEARYSNPTWPIAKSYLFRNLSIELEGANGTIKTVVVPEYELGSHQRGASLDQFGEYGVVNSSRLQLQIFEGENDYGDDFGILLGGIFLSQIYLLVDYERGYFGLADGVLDR
ncbi:hypothetical protein EJ08DRAFT_365481 [Tothia fuscella]|uniref:Peptidase A1 domain-containing protein n=1 Tax=Tothia fuscella TaxID=1048955 RepID=A0A9P4TVV0_9PEZI|nr:hypothetical protein EJ08DRAFT_365481 [Tothia fuscella]